MKLLIVTILTLVGMTSVATASPCNAACKANQTCASPTVSAAYKASFCPVYGKGGQYCSLYGFNC